MKDAGGTPLRRETKIVKSKVVFFPFDLFGSRGTAAGVELLADAFREMLADNRREKVPTRAAAYSPHVRHREFSFQTIDDLHSWRKRARQVVRQILARGEFLFWVAGNHLGVLPIYEELGSHANTLVIQFDAHLDVYNLSDCTSELSHGNFLLHGDGPLPTILNVGSRELLLRPEFVRCTYRAVYPASSLAIDPAPTLAGIRAASASADRVFLDLDCDVFDPAFFPALTHPQPFGLSPPLVLRLLDAAWSERVVGVSISEFDPARDVRDQSLATLVWLLEYVLLKRHEGSPPRPGVEG
jgi:arginase family enzyme